MVNFFLVFGFDRDLGFDFDLALNRGCVSVLRASSSINLRSRSRAVPRKNIRRGGYYFSDPRFGWMFLALRRDRFSVPCYNRVRASVSVYV